MMMMYRSCSTRDRSLETKQWNGLYKKYSRYKNIPETSLTSVSILAPTAGRVLQADPLTHTHLLISTNESTSDEKQVRSTGRQTYKKKVALRSDNYDKYMSYRWRESFNTVRSPSDSRRHHNGDWHVWAQNAERRGGMDHTSVAALTNQLCSDRGVVRVFQYSINVLYYKYGRNQSWRY